MTRKKATGMKDLYTFYQRTRPASYMDAWHLKQMCRAYQTAQEKRMHLIIEKSCRHGGSEVANIYGPAWRGWRGTLGRNSNSPRRATTSRRSSPPPVTIK